MNSTEKSDMDRVLAWCQSHGWLVEGESYAGNQDGWVTFSTVHRRWALGMLGHVPFNPERYYSGRGWQERMAGDAMRALAEIQAAYRERR